MSPESGTPRIAPAQPAVGHGVRDIWENTTLIRPLDEPCPQCGGSSAYHFLTTDRRRWLCGRCHQVVNMADPPFDDRQCPVGRVEGFEAIETIKLMVPVFLKIPTEGLYKELGPYFRAGWCARDVVYAINYLPDGSTQWGYGTSWTAAETRAQLLYRIRLRLLKWRWSGEDDLEHKPGDIMDPPYTMMVALRRLQQQELADRAAIRTSKWYQQLEEARRANPSLVATARQIAQAANSKALAARRAADAREAEAREEQALRARSASQQRLADAQT